MTDTARLAAALAGRYVIERELAAGGMATVYLAHDIKHDRPVALKVLRADLAAMIGAQRFLAEIKVTANLQHPHIVTLIDSGESEGTLWYVLPYIRGESLRERLTRERQLGVDETLTITRQIAGALDYAHAQGVIHRDIKPENILLHEGEAMLADFGIALAVKQAGGNRLTETGLSLGTPQYMSPEQATSDRALDGRSDVYSLGAVVYEMLAGQPPHTGATAHAIIAQLLTERPVALTVVRPTLPPGIDRAVFRALEKVAADRFPTAGELARALDAARAAAAETTMVSEKPARRTRRRVMSIGIVTSLLLAGVGVWAVLRVRTGGDAPPSFNQRTQVTFSGDAASPSLSRDGTQVAYVIHTCTTSTCTDDLEIQDVDGGASRKLIDGVRDIAWTFWSPDRRFLLVLGTIGGRDGNFLVPTLGGAPRFLGPPTAAWTFLTQSDSLIVNDGIGPDTASWIRTETVDGQRGDSVLVGPSPSLVPQALSGDRWLLVEDFNRRVQDNRLAGIVDRLGHKSDQLRVPRFLFPPTPAGDAVWFSVSIGGTRYGVVRLPVDLRTGKFKPPMDTVVVAASQAFSTSADGRTVAYLEGIRQHDLWTMSLTEAFQGRFTPEHHLLQSTSFITGDISPDGSHVLVGLSEPGSNGNRARVSNLPVSGGPGIDYPDGLGASDWTEDGARAMAIVHSATATQFVTVNPKTGLREQSFSVPDTSVSNYDPLPNGGWAWLQAPYRSVRIQRGEHAKPYDIALPAGERAGNVNASPDGTRLVVISRLAANDSTILDVVSVSEGHVARWAELYGAGVAANWLADRSLMVAVNELGGVTTMYRLTGPGQIQRLGAIPRTEEVTWSRDGKRVAVITSTVRGDVWLARSSDRPR